MNNKYLIMFLILLVVSLNTAYAGNVLRLGSAGGQELRLPVGSRGTALGGAVVADVTGVESIFWNPAGLANTTGTEAMFSHQPYLADIDVNFVGVVTRIEDFGTVGFGAKIVSIGDIEETTEDYSDGTGRTFSPTLSVVSLSYARILTSNVSFGFSTMFINEKIFEVSASGIAFDVGIIFDPNWNGLKLGMAIKNYGPQMEFGGRGFDRSLDGDRPSRPIVAPFDLPSSINFGASYRLYNQDKSTASLNGNFRSNNFSQDVWQGGAEYVFDEKYSLRAGYNYSDQADYIYGASFGGGLMFDLGGTAMSFEYTWAETGELFDANQYFTLKMQF
jgi:hypothetical protein